jgi:hypothetical protein
LERSSARVSLPKIDRSSRDILQVGQALQGIRRFVANLEFLRCPLGTAERLVCSELVINGGSSEMRSKLLFVTLTATSILAVPVGVYAQGQTDSTGKAMGSRHVTNANRHVTHSTSHKMRSGTVGANMGTHRAKRATPSSTQGDVGPSGNNNGTVTSPTR